MIRPLQWQEFCTWLKAHGADIKPSKEWEVARWVPQDGSDVRILYHNKKNEVTRGNGQEAWDDWIAFITGDPAHSVGRPRTDLSDGLAVVPRGQPIQSAWTVTETRTVANYTGCDVHDEKGRWIATIHGTDAKYKPLPDYEQVRRLIGAAPKLLEHLEYVEDCRNSQCPVPPERWGAIHNLLENLK